MFCLYTSIFHVSAVIPLSGMSLALLFSYNIMSMKTCGGFLLTTNTLLRSGHMPRKTRSQCHPTDSPPAAPVPPCGTQWSCGAQVFVELCWKPRQWPDLQEENWLRDLAEITALGSRSHAGSAKAFTLHTSHFTPVTTVIQSMLVRASCYQSSQIKNPQPKKSNLGAVTSAPAQAK